jgi:imidazole glycerol-phosphate synthase subunit HisH
MVTIIDYGVGNLGSIQNMLKKIGVDALVSANLKDIESATKLILPGVGSFDYGMQQLAKRDFISTLNQKVLINKTPILGVCLGAQLFTKSSEEGSLEGLGWFDAEAVKFKFDTSHKLKIPNMGWQDVSIKNNSKLTLNLPKDARYYFVHSYHLECKYHADVILTSNHGYDFPCGIERDNIVGVQFHPEKSHKFGMALLKNFVEFY